MTVSGTACDNLYCVGVAQWWRAVTGKKAGWFLGQNNPVVSIALAYLLLEAGVGGLGDRVCTCAMTMLVYIACALIVV